VATQDPQAGCSSPGWNPDAMVCDDDGRLATALGAQDRLPAAFLWSWQGHLLVRNGHVDEVEAAIERWVQESPRIHVEVGEVVPSAGIAAPDLAELVRGKLADQDKLTVIASAAERARLDALKAESLKARYDDNLACELGKDLSANSLLNVAIRGTSSSPRLHLSLLSVERGCMVGSAVVDWTGAKARVHVAEAVSMLMHKLRPRVEMPRAPASSGQVSVRKLDDGRAISNPVVDDKGFLFVSSEPRGAQVFINGKPAGRTPYQDELMVGEYVVLCRLGSIYRPARKKIRLTSEGAKVTMKLEPDFGVLKVESDPPGATVELDGEPTGEVTPVTFPKKRTGQYRVTVLKEGYVATTKQVRLGDGKVAQLRMKLAPDFGSLSVTSTPPGLSVLVDGKDTGKRTPVVLARVGSGVRTVEVRSEAHAPTWERIKVERGRRTEVSLSPKPLTGVLKLTAVLGAPSGDEPVQAEVWVDGRKLDQTTPCKAELPPGEHEVVVQADGAERFSEMVRVQPGQVASVDARLVPARAPPGPIEPEQSSGPAAATTNAAGSSGAPVASERANEVAGVEPGGNSAATWLLGGGGAMLVAGGVSLVLGYTALHGTMDETTTSADFESAKSTRDLARHLGVGAAGVGGALVVSGLVVLLTEDSAGSVEGTVAVAPSLDGRGLVLAGRF